MMSPAQARAALANAESLGRATMKRAYEMAAGKAKHAREYSKDVAAAMDSVMSVGVPRVTYDVGRIRDIDWSATPWKKAEPKTLAPSSRVGGALNQVQAAALYDKTRKAYAKRDEEAKVGFIEMKGPSVHAEVATEEDPRGRALVDRINAALVVVEAQLGAGLASGKIVVAAAEVLGLVTKPDAARLTADQMAASARRITAFANAADAAIAGLRAAPGAKNLDALAAASTLLRQAASVLVTLRDVRLAGLPTNEVTKAVGRMASRLADLAEERVTDPSLVAAQLRLAAEAFARAKGDVEYSPEALNAMTLPAIRSIGVHRGYIFPGRATKEEIIREFLTQQRGAARPGAGARGAAAEAP